MKRDLKLIAEAYEEVGEVKPKLMIPDPTGELMKWIKTYECEIHEDGGLIVYEDFFITRWHTKIIPFKFTKTTGDFNVYENRMFVNLEGAPIYVGETFRCYENWALTSLQGGPEHVEGNFICFDLPKLISLEGSPEYVGGYVEYKSLPNITSLKGAPKNVGSAFGVADCPKLKSLEGLPPGCTSYKIEGFTQEQIDDYFTGLELKDTATGDPTFDDFFGIGGD